MNPILRVFSLHIVDEPFRLYYLASGSIYSIFVLPEAVPHVLGTPDGLLGPLCGQTPNTWGLGRRISACRTRAPADERRRQRMSVSTRSQSLPAQLCMKTFCHHCHPTLPGPTARGKSLWFSEHRRSKSFRYSVHVAPACSMTSITSALSNPNGQGELDTAPVA